MSLRPPVICPRPILSPRLPLPSCICFGPCAGFLPVLQSDLISTHHCLNARRRHDFHRWVCSTLSGQRHRRRTSGAFHVITFPLKLCCNFLRSFAEVVLASLMVWSDIHLHHALPQPLSLQRDERMHQLITIPLCTSHTASHLSTFIILHPDSSTVIVFYSGTPWQTPRDVNKSKNVYFKYSGHTSARLRLAELPCTFVSVQSPPVIPPL